MAGMNRRAFGRTGIAGLAGLAVARSAPSLAQSAAGRSFKYVHLDVFTDRRYQGNQLLVFTEPAGLDTETMQTMTKESNYSECTFVPPDRAGSIVFLQGVKVGRPSRLYVRIGMTGADVTSVKVGGSAVVVGEGAMTV